MLKSSRRASGRYTSFAARGALAVGLATIGATPALAQIDDIIVTARKRDEGTQNVPVTISAVSTKTLEKYAIDDPAQLVTRIPGLQMSQQGSGSSGSVRIRGIGNSNISAAFETAVALNIDGVQSNMARILRVPLLDLKQIEVLKGPQALYFGKGASAGVITISTGDPTDKLEAKFSLSHEFSEHGWRAEGYVSGPITDNFKVRVAGSFMDNPKVIHVSSPIGFAVGGFSGVGTVVPGFPSFLAPVPGPISFWKGERNWDGRITAQWDPTPNLSAKVKYFHQKYTDDGYAMRLQTRCIFGGNTPTPTNFPIPGLPVGKDHDCNIYDREEQDIGYSPAQHRKVPGHSDGRPYSISIMDIASLKLDWSLTDAIKVTSVTGWLKNHAEDGDSNGGSNTGSQAEAGAFNLRNTWSEELRIASDTKGMFDFMVGGYWQHQNVVFDTNQLISPTVFVVGPDPVTGNDWDYNKRFQTKINAISFFGNLTFRPIENVEINGGARWSHEHHTETLKVPYMHAFLAANGLLPSGSFVGPVEFKDNNVSPEATILWKATPNINVFVAYKTGFKSGGLDNSVLPFAGLTTASLANAVTFKSEKAKGFEAGIKTYLMNRSVRFNVTGFHYKISNLQLQEFNTNLFQFSTKNAGEVTSQGAEIEGTWQTPVHGLVFNTGWVYSDSKYTKDFFVQGAPYGTGADSDNRRGTQLPGNSKISGYFGLDYEAELSNALKMDLGFTASHRSKFNTGINGDMPVQAGFWKIDTVVSLGAPNDRWKLSLIAQNLFDQRNIEATESCRATATPGISCDYNVEVNRARMITLEASVKF